MKYLFLFLLVFTSGAAVATEPGSQYQQQAEAGDRRAQYYLADTWVSSGDYQKAEYWAQKAAAQGDGDALAVLVIAKWEHKFDRKKALAYEREVLGKFDKTAQ